MTGREGEQYLIVSMRASTQRDLISTDESESAEKKKQKEKKRD